MFPFARFPGVDPVLGPEMRSTGEVMGIDRDFALAFAKSQIGAGQTLPQAGRVSCRVRDIGQGRASCPPSRELIDMGFAIVATRGTKRYLRGERPRLRKLSTRFWRAAPTSSTP